MSDDNDNGRPPAPGGRTPLTLKPRGVAGSVSAGTVKQSFSHGRSKTVVVETKRARTHTAPPGNLAAPSPAEKRVFTPPAPSAPRPAGGPTADGNLSAEEQRARQRAIDPDRRREAGRVRLCTAIHDRGLVDVRQRRCRLNGQAVGWQIEIDRVKARLGVGFLDRRPQRTL